MNTNEHAYNGMTEDQYLAHVLKIMLDWNKAKAIIELWSMGYGFADAWEHETTSPELAAALALLSIGDTSQRKIILAAGDVTWNFDLWFVDTVQATNKLLSDQTVELGATYWPKNIMFWRDTSSLWQGDIDSTEWLNLSGKSPKQAAKILAYQHSGEAQMLG